MCIDGYYLKPDFTCELITNSANSLYFDFCLSGKLT